MLLPNLFESACYVLQLMRVLKVLRIFKIIRILKAVKIIEYVLRCMRACLCKFDGSVRELQLQTF